MGLKCQNYKFNILLKIAFSFFNKMLTFWSSEMNKVTLEQRKVAE